ncbi:MAG: thioredoxin family protein [Planctomycetes bacterium]|nr:thioredoxin family protein [Planctomycetota bacterium]
MAPPTLRSYAMLCTLLTLVLVSSAARIPGEPFSELGFEPALAKAKSEKKLLVIDFTASWCPPCKRMDKDTWAAAEVRAWLGAHAIALQIDVDEEDELARRFKVQAMPTVVALRDGQEFDRFVGYRDAPRFLAWAKDLGAGRRASDELLARSKTLRESQNMPARHELARELRRAGLHDEALFHYLWLWPATRAEPAFRGVRVSFMLRDMAELAEAHAPAKKAFEQIFAELQAKVDATPLPAELDWMEWSAFCHYFDARARVLAWYEARRDEEGRLSLAEQAGAPADPILVDHIVDEIFDALMQEDRHQDAVRLVPDVGRRAERLVEAYQQRTAALAAVEDEEARKSVESDARRALTDNLSKLYGALLADARGQEAAAVAGSLLATFDTPESRIALVRQGVALSKTDPLFTLWLYEAAAAGAEVSTLQKRVAKLEQAAGG